MDHSDTTHNTNGFDKDPTSTKRIIITLPDSPVGEDSEDGIIANFDPLSNIKLVQLLPGSLRGSVVNLESLDPVVVTVDGEVVQHVQDLEELESFAQRPLAEIGISAIPPSVMHRLISTDDEDDEEITIAPIIHGRVTPRLSVSEDGFIRLLQYKISFDVIGGGKLSEVRMAIDERTGLKLAVKIFSKTKLKKMNMLLRASRNPIEEAYREYHILRRLDHENVIRMVDFIDEPDGDNIFLFLEYMDRVLMDVPSSFRYGENDARKYFQHVVRGVEHLHSRRIVHRDLKPQNLLVSKDNIAKIADFNFCDELVLLDNGEEAEVLTAAQGTPAFTAPECLLPDKKLCAGRPLDMWGLGATLYVLVVGDLPFKALLLPELFDSIVSDPVVFPADLTISDDLKDLILGLMEKDPAKRLTMSKVLTHPWVRA